MDTQDDDDNLISQKDEIEALESIYGDDFAIEDEFCPTISILIRMSAKEKDEATLVVSFNSDYPNRAPPTFHLSVPWMKRDEKQVLDNSLNETYSQHMGESIVYTWVESLRELLLEAWKSSNNRDILNSSEITENGVSDEKPPVSSTSTSTITSTVPTSNVVLPEIFTGEPLTDRKSTFQAHVAQISHVQQVSLVLNELKKSKKIATATHNMYAYRIFQEESKSWQQDCDDDGETHAGGRLLHLLQILNCSNVIAIVTRWFGGIMLRTDRFKHINNVARQELEKQGFMGSSKLKK